MSAPARTRLPHALAALYALAVVYASLGPFGPWMAPPPATRFFLLTPWPMRMPPRYDVAVNVLAYLPFGLFMALWPFHATTARRIAVGTLAGAALSLAMESLQMLVPARDATPYDFLANAVGALLGAGLGTLLARNRAAIEALSRARTATFVPGHLGDMGLALLAVWLVAQMNPGIPLFAVAFHPPPPGLAPLDGAEVLLDATGSAFQLIGVALFTVLLLRDGESARSAVLALVGAALLLKIGAAAVLLKPTAWQSWIRPGVLTGIAAGALLLPIALALPRPAQVATCGVALLASLVTPLVAPELIGARASMGLFEWRTGQLLNWNGLTHVALLAWPLFAAAWLFALAGRPAWGRANEAA